MDWSKDKVESGPSEDFPHDDREWTNHGPPRHCGQPLLGCMANCPHTWQVARGEVANHDWFTHDHRRVNLHRILTRRGAKFQGRATIISLCKFYSHWCRKLCGPHATGPTLDQAGLIPTENTFLLNVRLDLRPLIRLQIGFVDVGFLAKKYLVSVTLWNLSI